MSNFINNFFWHYDAMFSGLHEIIFIFFLEVQVGVSETDNSGK